MNKEDDEVTVEEHNAFLISWMSDYVACTTFKQVVLEYNCYIAKIMAKILVVLFL